MDGTIRTRSFAIDRASYLKAMWSRGLGKRLFGIVAFVMVAVALLSIFGGAAMAEGGAIGGFGVIPLVVPLRYLASYRTLYSADAKQAFDDPRTMEFSDSGTHTLTVGGVESTLPWSHVQGAERRGGFTVLMVARNFMAVPDSAFATPGDRGAFLALLQSKNLLRP